MTSRQGQDATSGFELAVLEGADGGGEGLCERPKF